MKDLTRQIDLGDLEVTVWRDGINLYKHKHTIWIPNEELEDLLKVLSGEYNNED